MKTRIINGEFIFIIILTSIAISFIPGVTTLNAQDLKVTQIKPLSGASGTSVTLLGTNFDELPTDNIVTFTPAGGGPTTTAAVTEVRSSSLTITVPPALAGSNYVISVQRNSDEASAVFTELFAVSNEGGEIDSNARVITSNANDVYKVYAGDVDGDGDIDIISGSFQGDEIAWYENDGSGNFPSFTRHIISAADGVRMVYAGDVDGDGDLDLMSASSGDNTLAWYENDGAADPAFTKRVVNTTSNFVSGVFAGDVDGDGDLDLMSGSVTDDKISWYENDGAADPTFTEQIVSETNLRATNIYASDLDGDGDLDLISPSGNNISWYENDGAADPGFTERIISTENAGTFKRLYATDLDGDGDTDLVTSNEFGNTISWYENDGNTDPSFTEHDINTNNKTTTDIYAGDMDGDGDVDLMSSFNTENKISWYENDGSVNPTFTERVVSTTTNGARSIYAADLDSDGDLDLISASQSDDEIAWHENTTVLPTLSWLEFLNGAPGTPLSIYGTGFDETPGGNTVTFAPAKGGSGTTAAVIEVSSSKIIVNVPTGLTGGNYKVRIERGFDGATVSSSDLFAIPTKGGSFGAVNSSEQVVATHGSYVSTIYAGDVDGDGDLDLMSAVSSSIIWYENNGIISPSFTPHTVSNTHPSSAVYAGDVDGDGDLDLIVGGAIAWYENNGVADPGFTKRTLSITASASDIRAGDLDGDGDLDLISAAGNNIYWYENDGTADPAFTERVISANDHSARGIYARDIDSDGDLDLVSLFDNDTIVWYENDGTADPAFTGHIVSTEISGNSVYAGDMDGDGDMDLLSARINVDENDVKVIWFENNGASEPVFTEHLVSASDDETTSVQAADMDGDGDLDILSASEFNGIVAWYENDGSSDPGFTKKIVSNTANNAPRVYAADVDGDGDLDVISAFNFTVAWYENATPPSISGRSLTFDGNGDYLDISGVAADLGYNPDFTFEAWVKPDVINQVETSSVLFGQNSQDAENRLLITIDNIGSPFSRRLRVQDGVGTVWEINGPALTSGQWYHVAYTLSYDEEEGFGRGTLFLDGDQVGEHELEAGLGANDKVSIGQEYDEGFVNGNFLLGLVDEVRIWGTVRSAQEIQQNMFQALTGNEPGLYGYWNLNEVEGEFVSDITSNNNEGTLYGDAGFSTNTHPYGTFIDGEEGWRMMTAPVSGVSYGELLEPLWTQGFSGADESSGTSNVYEWDEAAKSFSSVANATDIPGAGTGFIVYMYDDHNGDETPDGFPKIIRTDSTQRSGLIMPDLSFTDTDSIAADGWNLIGNPYGASIDWDTESGLSSANLDNSFYVWSDSANDGAGDYLSWNGSTGTFGGGEIAPWQGFWVKASAADPSLIFTDDVRSAGGILRKKTPVSQLKFTLEGPIFSSKTILMFSENAFADKDEMDAYKLQSLNTEYLSLFTKLEDGTGLDINALPAKIEESRYVGLGFDGSNLGGSYELKWNSGHLPENLEIKLVDNETGTEVDLTKASSYSFELEAKAKAASVAAMITPQHQVFSPKVMRSKSTKPRFTILMNSKTSVGIEGMDDVPNQVELSQNYPNPFNPTTAIQYGVPETGQVSLEIFNMLGQKVATLINKESKTAGLYSIQFDAGNLASGLYLYRLKAGNTIITKKLTLIK